MQELYYNGTLQLPTNFSTSFLMKVNVTNSTTNITNITTTVYKLNLNALSTEYKSMLDQLGDKFRTPLLVGLITTVVVTASMFFSDKIIKLLKERMRSSRNRDNSHIRRRVLRNKLGQIVDAKVVQPVDEDGNIQGDKIPKKSLVTEPKKKKEIIEGN